MPSDDDATPSTAAFIAFAEHGMIRGAMQLRHRRLADAVESGQPLRLTYAAFQDHAGGPVDHLGTTTLSQERLVIIIASGPSGSCDRRIATVEVPVRIQAGLFEVVGRLHVAPGGSAADAIGSRRWLALTGAVVCAPSRGSLRRTMHPAVLVATAAIGEAETIEDEDYVAALAAGRVRAAVMPDRVVGAPAAPADARVTTVA